MKKTYPDEITPEALEKLNNISNEEILKDIQDTEAEIIQKQRAKDGYEILAVSGPLHERRMYDLCASGAKLGIEERQAFVGFLNRLLDARQVTR